MGTELTPEPAPEPILEPTAPRAVHATAVATPFYDELHGEKGGWRTEHSHLIEDGWPFDKKQAAGQHIDRWHFRRGA